MSLAVLADHMASKGRGPDSMLIHMSPREVQGLQALAMKHGGSLTINPDTGLPEAGFLDKLLPTIIGAGISFFSGGAINPLQAAAIVGGIQTVRTGDIGKGLAAGLGAYGGAGLTSSLTTAGASALSGEATSAAAQQAANLAGEEAVRSGIAQGFTPEMLEAAKMEAIDTAGSNTARVASSASPFDKLSAGAKSFGDNPMSFANKDNLKYLAAAAGPAIMAGANVQAKGPQTVTKPGMIRPYSYDPYSGGFTAASPYEAAPTRAAEGGLMGMADGGYSPGMLDFAQRSEPVLRMAEGGVPGYAIGGDTKAAIDAAYAAGDYGKVNELAQANKITAEDVAATYKGFDTSGLAGLGINLYTPPAVPEHSFGESVHSIVTGQDYPSTGGGLAALNTAAPTYNQYTDQQIADYLRTNPNVDINEAIRTTNADPAAVNRYLASLASPFKGSTETTGGSGTLGIYNNMVALGVDPNEYYKAALANDPKYAGWSLADIQRGYNLDKGAYALSNQLKGVVSDKDWVKFMDENNYSINDAAQAFGLSLKEVRDRYNAVKNAEKKIDKPVVTGGGGTGGGGTGGGTGAGTSVIPDGYYGNDTGNPLTRTPGDITRNPDGTVTIQPNIPGRPTGGFPGMASLRDAYTAGGGSLGYIPYAPKTIEEFESKYNKLTGGSKQSYDYLTGKTPYSPTPYTPTGEVMKPYAESVLGMPVNKSKRMYIFDPATKTYKINPDYAIPTYDKDGKKTYNLTNKDVITYMATKPAPADFYNWAKTNNLTVEQIAAATGMPITEVQKMLTGGTPADTATAGGSGGSTEDTSYKVAADGGLMAMARGGSTQYDLGDYSDGGRLLRGPGDGVSDSIPASIGNKRPARLADGEFVVPARIVSELGNGSTEAGARKLYAMMDRIQAARRGTVGKGRVAKNSRADKHLPA